MCIICSGLENNTLTPWEAATNLIEMGNSIEKEHFEELSREINDLLWAERANICIFCIKTPCVCHEED